MGIIADTMRVNLRAMAEADARLYRDLESYLNDSGRVLSKVSGPALPGDQIAAAIALLEANGYTVIRP